MSLSRKIKFNTGRKYSPDGQVIEAESFGPDYEDVVWDFDHPERVDSCYVIFHDLTRDIKGKIILCRLTEEDIMAAYDCGRYTDI